MRLGLRLTGLFAALAFGPVAAFCLADALFPVPLDRARQLSTVVEDRIGRPLRVFPSSDGKWRLPARAAGVPDHFRLMLTHYEDKRFDRHPGVDPLALARAAAQAVWHGRIVSGGSTLTMQTARLLEPRPKGLSAKFLQMFRAVQLERRFTKNEILSLYLTLAPYGGNIEGVESAAQLWFGKSARQLDVAEAALLVALPQSPTALRPDRHGEAARAGRDKALRRAAALLPPGVAEEATAEPVPSLRAALPFLAPHLSENLARRARGQTIRTTLDGDLQAALEALARRQLLDLAPRANLAIVVVENRTRRVLAQVGGVDYFDDQRAGRVDLASAYRSPGSTLKPFIYGMGFDDAIVHPQTIIADAPTRFGDYAPANFDRRWHGEITAAQALQNSLNIPAVAVLDRVGPMRFAAALGQGGVRMRLPKAETRPGLAIGLGGSSLRLVDLVSLYAGLGDDGAVEPLITLAGQARDGGFPLLSKQSAAIVLDILRGAATPDGFAPAEVTQAERRIAVKTGTSFGFRDAWAVGVSASHSVGVWVGRPDGAPSPGRYGRNTAAPLTRQIFDLLPSHDLPAREQIAVTASAPDALRRLTSRREPAPDQATLASLGSDQNQDRLTLVFPPAGALLPKADSEAAGGFTLRAVGGRRPLAWLIDGRPLPAPAHRRETRWIPDGEGFHQITVIDADGATATASVRIR